MLNSFLALNKVRIIRWVLALTVACWTVLATLRAVIKARTPFMALNQVHITLISTSRIRVTFRQTVMMV